MNFKRKIFFLLSLFLVQLAIAQGGVTIKASVDKNKILIGEKIQLTIEAFIPTRSLVKFADIDSLTHFELEKPAVDTVDRDGGINIIKKYSITSFDSGHWVIPAFILSSTAKTDTIPVDVIFSDFDPKQEYHDIKDILEVNPPEEDKKKWWLFAMGGALLLALLIFYFNRKKRPQTIAPEKTVANPYEEAMKQLDKLQKDKPAAKEFYSTLTDVFRLYVFRKKGILSLQKTTDDLVLQLKDLELPKDQFDKLAQALRLSDFVKFAKFVPSPEDDMSAFEEIKKTITTIEKTETKVAQ
jgi:hypothetical protein